MYRIKNTLYVRMHIRKNAVHPIRELQKQYAFFQVLRFPLRKCTDNLTVDLDFGFRFNLFKSVRKTTAMNLSKMTRWGKFII